MREQNRNPLKLNHEKVFPKQQLFQQWKRNSPFYNWGIFSDREREDWKTTEETTQARSKFEKNPSNLRMEIFSSIYVKPRLSPSLSLKREVKGVKMGFFGFFRLVFGFLVLAL